MRTKVSLQRIAFGPLTILILLVFFVAGARSVTAQCPLPTVKNAVGECVLISNDEAVSISRTLILPSNTTLNCQSHTIIPYTRGIGNTRSKPEVAIFLNGAQNVKIKNCTISGEFDFGIFAINSNPDPDNAIPPIEIFNNKINARFVGISFVSVDNSEIRSNELTLRTKGGRAIYVGRDSDRNRILDNRIAVRIPNGDATKGFRVPGPRLPSNTEVNDGSAVLITQTEGPEPTLLNAIIEDSSNLLCGAPNCVFQLTVTNSAEPNGLFSEGNIFGGNIINFGSNPKDVDAVVLSISQRTRVSKNTITGGKSQIRVGFQPGLNKPFPGKCKNSGRFCLLGVPPDDVHEDCNIPPFDPVGNADTCENTTTRLVSWVSYNTIIQDNMLIEPVDFGIATTGEGTIITGNTIKGVNDPKTGIGIRLIGKFALAGTPPLFLNPTVVTRNTVTGLDFPLELIHLVPTLPAGTALDFKAQISLNDFFNNNTPLTVKLSNGYTLPTELSAISETVLFRRGNYWGEDCLTGLRVGPTPPVTDSHRFGARVADTPNTSGLTPCP